MPNEDVTDLATVLSEPLPVGAMRVLYCQFCGAVTYIRIGGNAAGTGDPRRHNRYHAERGEGQEAATAAGTEKR